MPQATSTPVSACKYSKLVWCTSNLKFTALLLQKETKSSAWDSLAENIYSLEDEQTKSWSNLKSVKNQNIAQLSHDFRNPGDQGWKKSKREIMRQSLELLSLRRNKPITSLQLGSIPRRGNTTHINVSHFLNVCVSMNTSQVLCLFLSQQQISRYEDNKPAFARCCWTLC